MKFDVEKRAADIRPGSDRYAEYDRRDMIQLAREAYEAGKRETAAAIAEELKSEREEEGHTFWLGLSHAVCIALRYAEAPKAPAPTPEAIEEAKAAMRVAAWEGLTGGDKLIPSEKLRVALVRLRTAPAKLEGRS